MCGYLFSLRQEFHIIYIFILLWRAEFFAVPPEQLFSCVIWFSRILDIPGDSCGASLPKNWGFTDSSHPGEHHQSYICYEPLGLVSHYVYIRLELKLMC